MKAVYFERHGGPEVLEYGELPDPVPAPGEVVVDVHAASVNGADWKVRGGAYRELTEFPHVLGRDFSGVVSAVGDGADVAVGDEVFGVPDTVGGVFHEGAYAERIAIASRLVARKPASLSHVEAAAIGLIGITAVISLEDTLAVQPGETLLVQGGAGGVGGFAVALGRQLGARVIATTSTANVDYVRAMGADEVVDYTTTDFLDVAAGCDVAFDTVGDDVCTRSFLALRPGGRLASVAVGFAPPAMPRDDVTFLRPNVIRDRPHLERVAELVTSGAVPLPEITVFPLADAAEAHRISEGRHLRGKLVFRVR